MVSALSLGNVSAQMSVYSSEGPSSVAGRTQEETDDQLKVSRRSLDVVDGVRHAGIRAVGSGAP
jgi:hypothetical protein